jgi:hypothetical protein
MWFLSLPAALTSPLREFVAYIPVLAKNRWGYATGARENRPTHRIDARYSGIKSLLIPYLLASREWESIIGSKDAEILG